MKYTLVYIQYGYINPIYVLEGSAKRPEKVVTSCHMRWEKKQPMKYFNLKKRKRDVMLSLRGDGVNLSPKTLVSLLTTIELGTS